MKIKKVFKNRWGWTTAIIFIFLGSSGAFAFLSTLGIGLSNYLATILPIAIPSMLLIGVHAYVLGLGLEQIFKR